MSKWIKFGDRYILNTDKIKYCYIDEKNKYVTAVFIDDEELTLGPGEDLDTVRDWKNLFDSLELNPPSWIYEMLNGFNKGDF